MNRGPTENLVEPQENVNEQKTEPVRLPRPLSRVLRRPFKSRPWRVSEDLTRPRGRSDLDALVECARTGDAQAFKVVTERLSPQLMRFVSSYLHGDVHTAHDVVQDTFVTAWGKLGEIRDGGHLKPWLYKVARYKAISFLRRRGPRGTPMDSIDKAKANGGEFAQQTDPPPERRAIHAEPLDPWLPYLREAVAKLPTAYIAVVRLHYLLCHTTTETAHLLGLSRTTVKMRLYRARKMLKRLILEALEADREA